MDIREWSSLWDNRSSTWSHNILIGEWQERERIQIFGFQDSPHFFPDERFIEMDIKTRWPEIMVKLGLFSSITQAKKNGWDLDIPEGFSEKKIFREKKAKIHSIFIWKVSERIDWDGN